MPPIPHAKPENILKRAQELIAVDQSSAALTLLHEHVTSKRSRNTPIASLEPVMLLFVELCVDLRKGKTAKDGLYQYKNIAQNTSVQTIELVLRKFIELAENKVTEAQERAEKINLDAVEDLEATETPESILLSSVSGEQSKDRTDRAVVTPWLKFLWETYRTVLDILRNNARLEVMYQSTANQAFQFCLKYTRKTEFRRLCELLRNHMQNAAKYASQMHAINLNDPDTLQRHLDTRFQQLNAAVELELWQEAFRSVEDIHTLLTLSKRSPKATMMANYYEKLTRIFLVADNQLFHAAAWIRYYNHLRTSAAAVAAGTATKRESPVTSEAEITRVASYVILSALAIPVISTTRSRGNVINNDEANRKNKTSRLTNLLFINNSPTRAGLFKEALSRGLLKRARPEIRELYNILEVDFHPLSICKKISPILLQIAEDPEMKKYVLPLQQVILTRLFQQLSQVYETVQLEFVIDLATFPAPFEISASTIEKFIMNGCKKGDLAIRIDHAAGAITFEADIFSSPKPLNPGSIDDDSSAVQKLQNTPSEIVRTQLTRLSKAMYLTCCYVDPSYIEARNQKKVEAYARAEAGAAKEHKDTLARRAIIEKKKEAAENALAQKEKEDQRLRAFKVQQALAEESERLTREKEKREQERTQRELAKIRQEQLEKEIKSLDLSAIKLDPQDLTNIDSAALRDIKLQQLAKETNELATRLRTTGKRIDHIERAFRKEELTLLPQDLEAQRERDLSTHDEKVKQSLEAHKRKHEEDVSLMKRLTRLIPQYEDFRDDIRSRRSDEFEKRRKAAEQQLKVEMDKRRKQVKEERERKRRAEEEAERKRIEEEERLAKEEEERAAKEEAEAAEREARKAQREADRKEREEAARKQLQREQEAEERRIKRKQEEKEAALGSRTISGREPVPASAAASDARPEPAFRASKVPAPASGGWRERELAKAAAAAAAAASGETDATASEEKNGDVTVEKSENAPPAADTPSAPGKYIPRARREALGERSNSGDLPPPSTSTRPPREDRTTPRDSDRERPAKEDGESTSTAPALRGVTAGKWGERNTERRERDIREPRDRDTRETTTGTAAANGDERNKERPSTGRWQPSTRREGREGETMPEATTTTEGGDAAPKGAYRPGAYRARGGGGMGQRSGSGRDRDAGRDKEQKEGESTGSGGRWQR